MFRLNKRMWLLLSLALIALAIAPMASAQETTAGIQGTVRDSTGGVIAGARSKSRGQRSSVPEGCRRTTAAIIVSRPCRRANTR